MQDPSTAQQVLQQHWATWYTADDFAAMKAAGLNHVRCVSLQCLLPARNVSCCVSRIPLGYWSVPMNESVDPYIPGAWNYLLQALNWAKNNSLNVVLDLHGAPGSQNGYETENLTQMHVYESQKSALPLLNFLSHALKTAPESCQRHSRGHHAENSGDPASPQGMLRGRG